MKFYNIIFVLTMLNGFFMSAQDINQFDENGKHHGIWRKHYKGTKVLRYEGEFFHGKEVGEFRFYINDNGKQVLSATRTFSRTGDTAQVKFFNPQGKVISEGTMKGKTYIATWKYYQNKGDNLLIIERYNDNGYLEGERLTYYENGQVAELQHYIKGKLEGESKWYSESGVVLKAFEYANGELNGPAKYYNFKGELVTEGHYKNDKKTGIWKYYKGNKLTEEKDFTYKPKYIKVDGKYKKAPQ